MKKGGVIAILAVLTAVLLAANAFLYLTRDKTGPKITFSDADMTYTEGEDPSALLEDVTAIDDTDGDVSDTLRVTSVIPNGGNTEVTVEYTAKDSSNNVTKKSRTIPYNGTASSDSAAADDGSADAANQNVQDETISTAESSVSTISPAENGNVDASESAAAASDETEIASLTAGSPEIRLTTHSVTISVGDTFSYMTYIDSMTDDKDDRSTLSRRIELNGNVDTSTAGTYTVTYVIRDSDGNISNQPTLTVTVR